VPITTVGFAEDFSDFAPMAERAVSDDAAAMMRFRAGGGHLAGFVRLPFDVLAGRTVVFGRPDSFDLTVAAADFLLWIDGGGPEPARRDAHWLSALPPRAGWERVESVPDGVIRDLIRASSEVAQRASTRSEQESLLASTVLSASSASRTVEVPLGPLTALTRMGFLPRGTSVGVDVRGAWTRLAAKYGSTFVTRGATSPGVLGLPL